MGETARHIRLAGKMRMDDLDWDEARRVGLTRRELQVLPYFADVEGQTVFYMLEILKLKAAREPDIISFSTIWNYEEYFHSHAIMQLLEACGHPLEEERAVNVRGGVKLRAHLEDLAQIGLSKVCPRSFLALWMTWGASQEMLTAHAYDQLASTTANPVLVQICKRIAKQERRHFAWYYRQARRRLAESRFSQWFVRRIFEMSWSPVGLGVKSRQEVAEFISLLFPGGSLHRIMRSIDHRLGALPGMDGFDVTYRFAERIQADLPPPPPDLVAEVPSVLAGSVPPAAPRRARA